jgi:thymidylate synthase ThyX
MAASGARYSRNNQGLDAILEKIDPNDMDKSVDAVFKFLDYGHLSIQDLCPISLFLDDLSMWLVYLLWTLCPIGSGQESSTRYIKVQPDSITPPEELGIDTRNASEWQEHNLRLFDAYDRSVRLWEEIVASDPSVARIPKKMLEDDSEKTQKAVKRMFRNYAFDRARYFLPLACRTNVMLVMSARGWVQLVQHLLSHPLVEANSLGWMITEELELVAPRMLRHASAKSSIEMGILDEFSNLKRRSQAEPAEYLRHDAPTFEHPVEAYLEVMKPRGVCASEYAADLSRHDNRYAWTGAMLRRVGVRFGWQAVAIGEVRDLNRHRTGNKFCPLLPVGFYCAEDQLPAGMDAARRELHDIAWEGYRATAAARNLLSSGDPSYCYYLTLGSQTPFEHFTTADKFIYEAELRTGTGAHFRYAAHLRDVLALWYEQFPETKGLILEGSAEPE